MGQPFDFITFCIGKTAGYLISTICGCYGLTLKFKPMTLETRFTASIFDHLAAHGHSS